MIVGDFIAIAVGHGLLGGAVKESSVVGSKNRSWRKIFILTQEYGTTLCFQGQ